MQILIVEDEMPAYERLKKLLLEVMPIAEICGHCDSIQSLSKWLTEHPLPDLLFVDIQLADGSVFHLLEQQTINCPIILTTAYKQYAIEAFKTSVIDYLLKPIKKEELYQAFAKLKQFRNIFKTEALPGTQQEYKKRFVVKYGDHIRTVNVEDIAYFYRLHRGTIAMCKNGRSYSVDFNLQTLETMLEPYTFFRINRQFIVGVDAIEEMKTYSKARVIITLKPALEEQPIVSSEKANAFKKWLAGEF